MPTRLRLRASPIDGESLLGFLWRVAARNGVSIESMQKLADLKSAPSNSPAPDDLKRLADCIQVSVDVLEAMSRRTGSRHPMRKIGRHLIRRDLLDLHHRKLCPECLMESPHHRAIWDVVLVTACPTHGKRMVSRCDDCERKLVWKGDDLRRCTCGRDLERIRPAAVSAEAAVAMQFICGSLETPGFEEAAGTVKARPPFVDLSPGMAIDFLRVLCLIRPGQWPTAAAVANLGDDAHIMVGEAYTACLDWPESMFRYLDRIGDHRLGWTGPNFTGMHLRRLGNWMHRLPPNEGTAIIRELAAYLREYGVSAPTR